MEEELEYSVGDDGDGDDGNEEIYSRLFDFTKQLDDELSSIIQSPSRLHDYNSECIDEDDDDGMKDEADISSVYRFNVNDNTYIIPTGDSGSSSYAPLSIHEIMLLDTPSKGVDNFLKTLEASSSSPALPMLSSPKSYHEISQVLKSPLLKNKQPTGNSFDHESTPAPAVATAVAPRTDDFFGSALYSSPPHSPDNQNKVDRYSVVAKVSQESSMTNNDTISALSSDSNDDLSPVPITVGTFPVDAAAGASQQHFQDDHLHSAASTQNKRRDDRDASVIDEENQQRLNADFSYFYADSHVTKEGIQEAYTGIINGVVDEGNHYISHVVECLIRPDIALKQFLHAVAEVADKENLIYVQKSYSHAILGISHYATACDQSVELSQQQSPPDDWDMIDVQVCISKELKQRVLLFQFMKRLSTFSPLRQQVPTSNPYTVSIMKTIRSTLPMYKLTLSSLYTAPLTDVCSTGGLDSDFKKLLLLLCREAMWKNLKEEYSSLDDNLKMVEVQCVRFIATIDSVYKSHNLAMPAPKSRRKMSDFPLDIDLKQLEILDEIEHEDEEDDDENKEEAVEEDVDLPSLANDVMKRRGSIKETPRSPLDFLSSLGTNKTVVSTAANSTPTTPVTTTSTSTMATAKGASTIDSSHSQLQLQQQQSNSGRSGNKHGSFLLGKFDNGLTLCLDMLNHCMRVLQRRCDNEFTDRLQQKNKYIVAIICDFYDYRKSLLIHLATSEAAYASDFNKLYISSFKDVEPTRPTPLSSPAVMDAEGRSSLVVMDDFVHVDSTVVVSGSRSAATATPTASYMDKIREMSGVDGSKAIDSFTSWLFKPTTPTATAGDVASAAAAMTTPNKPTFTAHSKRLVQTSDQAKARLDAYRKLALSDLSSTEENKQYLLNVSALKLDRQKDLIGTSSAASDEFLQMNLNNTVIYTCACLFNGVPCKVYITPHYLCMSYGVYGISSSKEMYPLAKLDSVIASEKGSALFHTNTLKLSFFSGSAKDLFISPVLVECVRLRAIILDIKDCFATVSSSMAN